MRARFPLKVLVVDDEPIARRRLQRLLRAEEVEIVGEAGDVASAIEAALQMKPDIMLLDVQMPGGDGFDVIEKLGRFAPLTIFVTAFDHHALRAFEVAAADYVTKPVDQGRLAVAVQRARKVIEDRGREEQVSELLTTVDTLRQSLRKVLIPEHAFWVKSRGVQVRIGIETIDYVRAERDYVHLHAKGQNYLVSENMTSIEGRLASHGFLRIHRSILVRTAAISSASQGRYGKMQLHLACGDDLNVGRSYVAAVRAALHL